MSRLSRCGATLAVVALTALTACSGGSAATASPSAPSTASRLQDQLDLLPTVDGATRTAHRFAGTTLTESFSVPAGAPACLQLLARLAAGGYQVVAGAQQAVVDPTTCRTSTGDPAADTAAGTATILARGGSQIALTWTAAAYTLTVSAT